MEVVIIDNYDSFTFNLSHLVKELGACVTVLKNDQFALEDLNIYDRIILSPGPGIPEEAGLLMDVIRQYAGVKPLLGVCLGHQAIGEVFGGRLINLPQVYHGIQSNCRIDTQDPIFAGLPENILVGRYHSWVIDPEQIPQELTVTAWSPENQIMAIRHKTMPVWGIQFHPESILTPEGKTIINNWLKYGK